MWGLLSVVAGGGASGAAFGGDTRRAPRKPPQAKYQAKMFEKKVKVGFFLEDDVLEGVPGIKRAVAEAVDALQQQGYEVR